MVGAVHTWGHMGLCWWGVSGQPEGKGVGCEATPGGLWGRQVSMEGGTWGGKHIQWVGGMYLAGVNRQVGGQVSGCRGGRRVNGEVGRWAQGMV